ncbi:MAG: YodL domain-containing protein [Oscillospiraceae bacterium]|nr:YodL domain-containing protein [Oscillospiraceae bacterium]
MLEKQTNKERLKEITDSIEANIQDLFQSDKYKDYLRTMSRFHKYSFNNTMLIHMQKPNATLVTGYSKWEQKFNRHVKRGEKGIKIIAPMPFKKKIEQEKLDPDTKLPMRDNDGNVIMEEKTVKVPMFRPTVVFDVSQTVGAPLPVLASDLKGDVKHFDIFMEALRRSSPVPIEMKALASNMDGYFNMNEQKICLREDMSEVQTVCAAVHEITHAKLHNVRERNSADENLPAEETRKNRKTEEVEAESVSFSVCAYYGIETGENSFGYIASWFKDRELKELRASLETINRTADDLITDIDRHFEEICKERGIDLSNERAENTAAPDECPSAEEQTQDTALDEYPMLDNIGPHRAYDQSLLLVSREKAAEMMDRDITVYAVNGKKTAMIFDRNEIDASKSSAQFAIPREEWEATMDFRNAVAERMNHQEEREAAFLAHRGDCFAIYQIKPDDSLRRLRYTSFAQLQENGLQPERKNYELAYTAPMSEKSDLDTLWQQFNTGQVADYLRPSMSVSDIVAIKQEGVVSCHYVDSVGFQEVENFLQPENYLRSAEMQAEDDYNMVDGIINNGSKQPTVAELEEQAKSGQPISLLDLAEAVQREKAVKRPPSMPKKKPSVLAKMRQPLPEREIKKTAPEMSADKEYTR